MLGWASELPVMVKMNYLEEKKRPKSDDPEYWDIWTKNQRTVDWKSLSNIWQDYAEESGDHGYLTNEEDKDNGQTQDADS